MTTVLVGDGPAMLGLLAGATSGQLDRLCAGGLTLVTAGPRDRLGAGRLRGYVVRSDTRARVFAECVPWLDDRLPGASRLVARCSTDESVPLAVAGRLLALAGQQLLTRLSE